MIHNSAQVSFPRTDSSGSPGEVVLAVHFYPDDHVEFEIRRGMGGEN
jgi:hypothetical protein